MPDDVKYCIDLDKKYPSALFAYPYPRPCLPVPPPVLTRTSARAYPYLRPRLPVPRSKGGDIPLELQRKTK